jgi:hypothetical protein
MRQTVIGVFEESQGAQAALSTLADERFDPARVHTLQTAAIPTLTDVAIAPQSHPGVLGHLRHFLAESFGPSHGTLLYDGVSRRGSAMVRVDVDDQPQAVRAELAMVKAGAIDITRQTND